MNTSGIQMVYCLLILCIQSQYTYAQKTSSTQIVTHAKSLIAQGDDLGLRLLIKNNIQNILNETSLWAEIRQLIQKRPEVGLDLYWYLESNAPSSTQSKQWMQYNNDLNQADRAMLAKRFNIAESIYVKWLDQIKQNSKVESENPQAYLYLLHMWGRALYGQGKFKESAQVYHMIGPGYFRIRQVLFEKMWASFRAEDYAMALGAVSSQKSIYFSRFMDPESYLVQIYIYKKLCRESELQNIISEMRLLSDELRKRDSNIDLSFGELEGLVLNHLSDERFQNRPFSFASSERKQEREKILNQIERQYKQRRPSLLKILNRALGYAELALAGHSGVQQEMWPGDRLSLLKQGYELWPLQGGEEWVDEFVSHRYFGGSLCK